MANISVEELKNVQNLINNLRTNLSSSRDNLQSSLENVKSIISELEGYNGAYDSNYGTKYKTIGDSIYEYKRVWSITINGESCLDGVYTALGSIDDDLAVLDRTSGSLDESIYAIARDIQLADNALAFGDDMSVLRGYNSLTGIEKALSTGMVAYESSVMGMVGSGAKFLTKPLSLFAMTGAPGSVSAAKMYSNAVNSTSQNSQHEYNYNFRSNSPLNSGYDYYYKNGYNTKAVEGYSYLVGKTSGDIYLASVSALGTGAVLNSSPVSMVSKLAQGSRVYKKVEGSKVMKAADMITDNIDISSAAGDRIASLDNINEESLMEARKDVLIDNSISVGAGLPSKKLKIKHGDNLSKTESTATILYNSSVDIGGNAVETGVSNIIYDENDALVSKSQTATTITKKASSHHQSNYLDLDG